MAKPKVYVVGVGMAQFARPGRDFSQMAVESITKALEDTKINVQKVNQVFVECAKSVSTLGNKALYEIGVTGIPIHNVKGILCLWRGKQIIESQNAECVLVFGCEHIELRPNYAKFLANKQTTKQLSGEDALEYMKKNYPQLAAKILTENQKRSLNNEIKINLNICQPIRSMNHNNVSGPLTMLENVSKFDGSSAIILASEQFVVKNNLQDQAVEIVGMEIASDILTACSGQTFAQMVENGVTKVAADKLYLESSVKRKDVDIVELQVQSCLHNYCMKISCEALGLCKPGKAREFDKRVVINPSGISQCSELYWQLLGKANNRQIPGAKIALQQSIGFGGEVVITLYKQGFPKSASATQEELVKPLTDQDPTTFRVYKVFKILEAAILDDKKNLIKRQGILYCFKVTNISGYEGMWIVDTKNKKGSVIFNGAGQPDVTIIMKDDDAIELLSGSICPQQAILQGKMEIQGNIVLVQKLVGLQDLVSYKMAELKSKF